MRDLLAARTELAEVEAEMVRCLDELGVREVLCSIAGLSAVGAAAILAQSGDLKRFANARSLVKHAGLNPSENTSGAFRGRTRVSKRGRPGLRLAAWRATWAVIRNNEVMAGRYQYLTGRATNRLTARQAHAACAGTLLRWIHALAATGQAFDPAVAGCAGHVLTRAA
jgi:transposase